MAESIVIKFTAAITACMLPVPPSVIVAKVGHWGFPQYTVKTPIFTGFTDTIR